MSILDTFKSRIQVAEQILITTHEFPDADGIGSEISLCLALRELGKKCFCVNEEPLLERYQYLDKDQVVHGLRSFQESHPHFIPDLIIVVDTNTKLRVGAKLGQYFGESIPMLYIDHHPCRGRNLPGHSIDVNAAATGQKILPPSPTAGAFPCVLIMYVQPPAGRRRTMATEEPQPVHQVFLLETRTAKSLPEAG